MRLNFLARLLEFFRPTPAPAAQPSEGITNKTILNEMVAYFKHTLAEESIPGRLIYPTSFTIIMTPEDYRTRSSTLILVLPEVVKAFYAVLREKIESLKPAPQFEPLVKTWTFRFSASTLSSVGPEGGKHCKVRPGHISILRTSYDDAPIANKDTASAASQDEEVDPGGTIRMIPDSDRTSKASLNKAVLQGFSTIGNGTYFCQFNSQLILPETPRQANSAAHNAAETSSNDALALLEYKLDGKRITYRMYDNLIHISGASEKRRGREFCIISSSDLAEPHLQIRYDPDKNRFEAAAFAKALLNEQKMQVERGGHWYPLSDQATLFLAGEVKLKFSRLR